MITRREAAAIVDAVFTSTGADGVFYASANHPLDTSRLLMIMTPGPNWTLGTQTI